MSQCNQQTVIWMDEFDHEPFIMTYRAAEMLVTKVESIDNGEEVCFFGRRITNKGLTKQVYTICSVFGGDMDRKFNRLNVPEWLVNEIKGGK